MIYILSFNDKINADYDVEIYHDRDDMTIGEILSFAINSGRIEYYEVRFFTGVYTIPAIIPMSA